MFNHLVDLPQPFAWAGTLTGELRLDYELLLHDYYLACPRVNGVTAAGRFCDLPPEACAGCLDGPARREEIARMLAGATVTETSLRHAEQLLASRRP